MNEKGAAELVAVLACVLWGFMGFFNRELMVAGLSALQISFVRLSATSALLFIGLAANPKLLKLSKRDIPFMILMGLVVLLYGTSYSESMGRIPLSIASILEMLSPVFVILFAVLLFGEIPARNKILALIPAVVGGALITGRFGSSFEMDTLGIALGVMSGVFLALSSINIKVVTDRGYEPISVIFWTFLAASIIAAPVSDPVRTYTVVFENWGNIALVLGLTVLMTALPFAMQAWSITMISVTTVSILSISQCVFCGIVGYFMYGEGLTAIQMIGMAIVAASLVMIAKADADPADAEQTEAADG